MRISYTHLLFKMLSPKVPAWLRNRNRILYNSLLRHPITHSSSSRSLRKRRKHLSLYDLSDSLLRQRVLQY